MIKLLKQNLRGLSQNPYPGRGFILGKDRLGNLVQIYWIMGRSKNSRNRVFGQSEGGRVFTEAADPTKVESSSLTIYDAMLETHDAGSHYIVSNGDQTNETTRLFSEFFSLEPALKLRKYEPDGPNFTPRITGASSLDGSVQISILRKSPWNDSCERFFYQYEDIAPGTGYCVTTYSGDGNPLPSFQGEPVLMPILEKLEKTADLYWNTLNSENKISLAAKSIDMMTGESKVIILNKYTKVQ